MRKIIFLVNPVSGTAKKDAVLREIEVILKAKSIHFEIIPTNPEGRYEFLRHKIYKEHITDIVIVGGDGSVNNVVQALRGEPVRFGIIPFGSGNGLALAANIPRNLRKAMDIILKGDSKAVDAFSVNDHFSCMLSGLG